MQITLTLTEEQAELLAVHTRAAVIRHERDIIQSARFCELPIAVQRFYEVRQRELETIKAEVERAVREASVEEVA